ncbi:ABC transporter permease [Planctomicrobium sp. SH661]|uniref:ABC transporter permease n=1 Tax=Planctomicrobium sp. SH661 TaxID=3448124 RepID=UPI003F5C3EB4
MVVENQLFQPGPAFVQWLVTMVACIVVALLVGLAGALSSYGSAGPRMAFSAVSRGIKDLIFLSPKRIYAIAILTFKEAARRKAFMIGFLFLLLFMFGGWFLGNTDLEKPAKPYVIFVITSMNFLLILMTLLVACWGIPADIKARSLHTVVTKPVRRSEILLGRMLGYASVITLVLLCTSVVGYFWILGKVPENAQKQLIARVPFYSTNLTFLDRNGDSARTGINVGDIWEYRSFVEGGTKARARWTFENLDLAQLRKAGKLRIEQSFEAFRTYKGNVRQQLRYNLAFFNPEKNLTVPVGTFQVEEHNVNVDAATVDIPLDLTYRDTFDVDAPEKTVNVIDDLMHDGKLVMEVSALEPQQYIGVAQHDLFIRLPDKTFLATYAKSCLGLWLLLMLIVIIGTSSSCFVKGPVATILTGSLIFVGFVFRGQIDKTLGELAKNQAVLGGGSFESVYRLLTQMNQQSPLPDNMGTDVIKFLDQGVFGMLRVVNALIPDLQYYSTSEYPANGFDVPWGAMLLPSLLITLAYLIPMVVLGYFSLQLRELEHK